MASELKNENTLHYPVKQTPHPISYAHLFLAAQRDEQFMSATFYSGVCVCACVCVCVCAAGQWQLERRFIITTVASTAMMKMYR